MDFEFISKVLNNAYTQTTITSLCEVTIKKIIELLEDDSIDKQLSLALINSFENLKKEHGLIIDTQNITIAIFNNSSLSAEEKTKRLLASAMHMQVKDIDKKILSEWLMSFDREITKDEYKQLYKYLQLIMTRSIDKNVIKIDGKLAGEIDNNLSHLSNKYNLDTTDSFESLFKKAFIFFRDITQTDYNQLILFTKRDTHLSGLIVYTEDIPNNKPFYSVVVQEGLIYKAYSDRRTILDNEVNRNKNYFNATGDTKSELVVPIEYGKYVYGAFNSESEEYAHYSKDMEAKIYELATEVAYNLKRLNFSCAFYPEDLPRLHYENGYFIKR